MSPAPEPAAAVDPIAEWVTGLRSFQAASLTHLEQDAERAPAGHSRCAAWLALHQHIERLRRINGALGSARLRATYAELLDAHEAFFEALATRAAQQVDTSPQALRQQARRGLGIRVAVAGKGGAGKSLISGSLARILARRGRRVLAVDLDPNPGLPYNLGVEPGDAGLPPEALEGDRGWLTRLAPGLLPVEALERFSVVGPDGVRYIGVGKITDPERRQLQVSRGPLFQLLFNLGAPGWDVVGDLEAGLNTPFMHHHSFADLVVLVVSPSWKSALTVRRLYPLVSDVPTIVVANRWRDEPDFPDLTPGIRIPHDPAVIEADRLGVALIDHAPGAPALRAIAGLADLLETREIAA